MKDLADMSLYVARGIPWGSNTEGLRKDENSEWCQVLSRLRLMLHEKHTTMACTISSLGYILIPR